MAADSTPHPEPDPVEPRGEERRAKHKGPVTLRRGQMDTTTTDQRLLDSRGPSDWLHADPWRGLRIQSGFVEGFGGLAGLGGVVTVFGSARVAGDSPAYALGVSIGGLLFEAGLPGLPPCG